MSTEEPKKTSAGLNLNLDDVQDHEETRLQYIEAVKEKLKTCLLYTSPSPRD